MKDEIKYAYTFRNLEQYPITTEESERDLMTSTI